MRAFLAAMVAMAAISVGANWALEQGPLAELIGPDDASVRLDR